MNKQKEEVEWEEEELKEEDERRSCRMRRRE